ncbi:alkylhydroperoxidase [Halobacteriales archaeon QS_1_68_20]|nr:MAG: alkylhydroperoxidase [Halobacteriales archaeon QS_1_68_20]
MTRFPVHDEDELPEDLRERIEYERDRAGFTPNVFLAYGYKPSHFRAFFQYYDALVEDTTLDRDEVEMIVVAVSGANDCLYCNVAHGALLRVYGDDPLLAEQLMSSPSTADLPERQKAMVAFAVKLTDQDRMTDVDEEDFQRLRDHGFTDEEIWDVGAVASFFNLSNRMAHLADMRPNEEFYQLGRDSPDDE